MTQMMDCSAARVSLGVYLLGAIDPAERAVVDNHLAGCRHCRDELAGLAGLPALLARVNRDEALAFAASGEPPASEEDDHAPPYRLLSTLPSADSTSVVARILSAAEYQASAITPPESYQAAMITQQVAYEAAEVRQALLSMQTELSDLATRIANTLPNPVLPGTPPTERSPASSAATPSTQPKARPHTTVPPKRRAGRHAARPARKLRTRPVRKPLGRPKNAAGQSRQTGAMRFAVIASSALLLFAAVSGVTEIYLHGFAFFVFRSVGTGETGRGPGGLQESQGPGQPDAPKPTPSHVKVRPTTRGTVAVHRTVHGK